MVGRRRFRPRDRLEADSDPRRDCVSDTLLQSSTTLDQSISQRRVQCIQKPRQGGMRVYDVFN